jgi:phospholipid transport system substrate-binding protein
MMKLERKYIERRANRRSGRVALMGLATVALMASAAPDTPLHAGMAPDVLIRSISNELLERIKADSALRGGDFARRQSLIDEKVAPYVDFERMARLSVGYGWRGATSAQRQALMREFRTCVILTYSGAMSRVTDEQVTVQPVRAQLGDSEVVVRTRIDSASGEPSELDYRLEKTEAGWKIYDVTIMGVSMVETFRDSFVGEIGRSGVEGLIQALADKNKQRSGSGS